MATGTTVPVAAHVVGDAFVKQYYTVLHHSPHVVHRFYTDLSKLTRAEAGPDGIVDTAVAQNEINSRVMGADRGNLLAEIKTIDSQESLSGGVLVMVTGSLASKNNVKRDFVQTFFLAPQEKGYFVLNDMLRYLEEEPQSLQSTSLANGTPDVLAPPVHTDSPQPVPANSHTVDHEVVEATSPQTFVEEEAVGEEVYDLNEPSEAVEAEESHPVTKEQSSELSATVEEEPTISTVETGASVHDEVQGQTPKKSYASIVGDGKSIYVKNLSMNITASQLEEQFVKFGAINGINQQGFGYAFVEFEDVASAQRAIDASPIMIGGRPAFVQEKRPASSRAGRGRILPGRGDRIYRNDGMRGRGYFGSRGQGRLPGQDQYFRGRGSAGIRGGNGGQHPGTSLSSIPSTESQTRYGLQGSGGPRELRRGAGNQATRNGPAPRTGSGVTAS
ncbi:hypothetical protein O6H91_12G048000 [Diphasiastrum complanatum]|uniref:Uncharacterized protein n=1 Tax=Diphasiastrum complanatum TaxID=34168 RepID=A0ACC2C1V1_DIPCM|nr:hypothetical protein O6H91_12G048000 [Diphasiastrum complanatum]